MSGLRRPINGGMNGHSIRAIPCRHAAPLRARRAAASPSGEVEAGGRAERSLTLEEARGEERDVCARGTFERRSAVAQVDSQEREPSKARCEPQYKGVSAEGLA